MPGQRGRLKPRYGRLAAAASSASVTVLALLGGVGVVGGPSAADDHVDALVSADESEPAEASAPVGPSLGQGLGQSFGKSPATGSDPGVTGRTRDELEHRQALQLPADSGTGRRAVFSESRQRVWLVSGRDRVLRTYLVSGSTLDNLDPGTYEVYSRSRQAWGIDDSGTMRFFVRFTQGDTGAAIGFHDIPIDEGSRVQSLDELGTPQSHGCIRQRRSDAKVMWRFAHLGTTVVVTT